MVSRRSRGSRIVAIEDLEAIAEAITMLEATIDEQSMGSDYDDLYFGAQDALEALQRALPSGVFMPNAPARRSPGRSSGRKGGTSAYHRRYSAAFKRLKKSGRYTKADGSWRKGGFGQCSRAAHREARG